MQELRTDSGNVLDAVDRVLGHDHHRVTRVSILDSLWTPLPGATLTGVDGYTIGGAVSEDLARSTVRTLLLELANPGGAWTPSGPGSFFYWDRMIRVERGVRVAGDDFYAPLGVFLIDAPAVTGSALRVTGADRMDRATGSEFTSPTLYASGERVGAVIRDILEDAGVGSERWSVDDGGATLGADRGFEVGDGKMQAALGLATSFSLDVAADARGWMVVSPKRDPATLGHGWHFHEGSDATYTGLSKTWSRDRLYNHVLVTNDTSDPEVPLVRAEASVTDPANPLRVTGPLGDRLFKYVSAMITTQGQADAVAASLLWEHALVEEEIQLEHVPAPVLEVGDPVHVTNAASLTDDTYVIRSMIVPLAGGPANLVVKKVRNLS